MFDDVFDAIEDDLDDVIRKSINDAALTVIPQSPEDTGRFKGNWEASIDRIGSEYDDNEFDTGRAETTVKNTKDQVARFTLKRNTSVSLYNNVAEDGNHYAQTVGYDQSGGKAADLMDIATSEALRTLDGK